MRRSVRSIATGLQAPDPVAVGAVEEDHEQHEQAR